MVLWAIMVVGFGLPLFWFCWQYRDPSEFLEKPSTFLNRGGCADSAKVIHRLLLWDESIPFRLRPLIWKSRRGSKGFVQYLWREADIAELLKQYPAYEKVYYGYKTKIQKADFSRYLIVYHFGGLYLDHDIDTTQGKMSELMVKYKDYDSILFEELTWGEGEGAFTENYRIRQTLSSEGRREVSLRVANYAFYASSGANLLLKVLEKCVQRADYEILEPYDVLFTTGPDVVSTVVAEVKVETPCLVVPKTESDGYFLHLSTHSWHPEMREAKPQV